MLSPSAGGHSLMKEGCQMRTYGVSMLSTQNGLVPCIVPFYTAEVNNSLERGSRPYTVVEILREVFNEDFEKAIQLYMDSCPEGAAVAIGEKEARECKLVRLGEPRVESTLRQPACTTAVDLVFVAIVEAMVPVGKAIIGGVEAEQSTVMKKQRFSAEFRMRYLIGLWDKHCSAPMIAPNACFPQDLITEQKTAITNQYLLPIMYADDYGKAAKNMLSQYYSEALDGAMPVDAWELARRMKLEVRRVRFESNSDIQGRIYFDWTWVKTRDEHGQYHEEKIPPMTVLINVDLCPTPEIENSTIVHECCHVFLDLPFFKLQMLSGRPFTSFTSRKRQKKRFPQTNGPIDWMELQAEKLPAYVLIEENSTRREIERMLAMKDGIRSPENMNWIMCQLAKTFKVTRSMAKYRMIELGYPEAEGIFVYIDNQHIPDYGCASTWERGITYAIALSDAGALLRESREFAVALGSGRYVYLEGHYCLDMEPYVECRYGQLKRLTAYARHHIEECCISFTVQGRYANTVYENGQAARKTPVKDKYQSRHGFGAEPETKERVKENTLFAQDSYVWMKLRLAMPDNIADAVQLILDEKGLTQQELSMRMGVSRAAFRKWCGRRMSLRHVVAVCIALDVRADIGLELVRLAGQTFQNNKEHNLLLAMLYETKDMTVARANEIMRQEKLDPLTEGIDEELAV